MGNCSCYNRGKESTPLLSPNWESLHAAKRGDLEALKNRLKISGTKTFHEPDEEGQTVLHLAANGGHLDCVTWLVEECKFSANQADKQGWTALHHASFHGHVSVIAYLIKSGEADTSIKDRRGNQPLHIAAEAGHLDAVKAIFHQDETNLTAKNRKGQTPLQLAVIRNRYEIVEWLLKEAKANPNASDSERNTALHYACEGQNSGLVELLIQHGAKVEVKNYYGQSPLSRASPANKAILVETRYLELAQRIKKTGILDVHGNELTDSDLDDLWTKLHRHIPVTSLLTELRIFNNHLTEFPHWLTQTINIQELYVAHNSIKMLPDWISTLSSLKKIDIDFLSTPLPDQGDEDEELLDGDHASREDSSEANITAPIGHLTARPRSPRSSRRSSIREELVIPESIGTLVHLETLSMTDNGITSLPNSIGNLTNLDSLNLKGNKLRYLPDSLCNCQALRELSLERNSLTTVPSGMNRLTRLELINLDRNPLKYFPSTLEHNVIFKWLADLKGLPFQ